MNSQASSDARPDQAATGQWPGPQGMLAAFSSPLKRPVARTCLIVLAVALFDVLMPLGVTAGALYMAAILSAVPIRHPRAIIYTAIACSVLIAMDAFLSPGQGQTETWKVVVNHLISLIVVWGTALIADAWIRVQRERTRQMQRNQLLMQAMSLSVMSSSFEDSLRSCVSIICEMANWPIGHVYFSDTDRQRLTSSDIWTLPRGEQYLAFRRRSDSLSFHFGEGIPGRIWEAGTPTWFSELCDPRFEGDQPLPMHAAFGIPIIAHDTTIAVVEFFTPSHVTPDPQVLLLAGSIGHQLGQMAERRRQTEERARVAAIVESSYDAIIGKDLQGRITSWNKGAELVYGYTESEALGETAAMLLPPGVTSEEPEIIKAVENRRRLVQFETTRRRKGGQLIVVAMTVSPILDSRDQVVGTSTIERDVTLRRRREQEIQAAREAAESANRAKSAFLANVSHELRTPMNAVMGMLDITLSEDLPDPLSDYLKTAREGAGTLLYLLDDLLDISRMEAGKLELEHEPFDLQETIDGAIRSLSVRASEKGLELAARIAPGTPSRLIGDGLRLRQVILNLAGNAVKFTEQGEVVVDVSTGSRHESRVELQISVRDTGIGIDPADQEQIFAPFTQADASTTRLRSGTGLGLAICRELIAKMNGRIWLESTPGVGSTFHCTAWLDLASGDEDESTVDAGSLDGLRVLVVDDNPATLTILRESLSNWRMCPTSADCGREAVEVLRRSQVDGQPFDLLMVDALMPEVDGFALLDSIDSEPNVARPKTVLMISPADRQTFRSRLERLEVSALLEKPVTRAALFETLIASIHGPSPKPAAPRQIPAAPIPRRVLVVEDTPANQKVMRAILGKRGHHVQLANNGREGVDLILHEDFDVVLMDVQMPTMDGLQATQAIRKLTSEEKSQVPIIAMTAHVRREDREKCFAAGMNAYIGKPIDAAEVIRMVEAMSPNPKTPAEGDGKASASELLIDLASARQRMGGDEELLTDMARFFLADSPQMLQDIRAAIDAGDTATAQRVAHGLKGLASNFNATLVVTAAQRLEDESRGSPPAATCQTLSELIRETHRVQDELRRALALD